jgi:hypothetical protein
LAETESKLKSGSLDFKISYKNSNYSPFPFDQDKFKKIPFEILDGKQELQWILKSEYQELASHTFSHYYALEKGQTKSEFEKDCQLMNGLAKELNHEFKSIVFPRNQIDLDYLAICANNGLKTYRGNQKSKSWTNSEFNSEGIYKKANRFGDAYFKVEETKSHPIEDLEKVSGLLNIPANRFLRPVGSKKWLEKRKIKRIKNEMTKAAKAETVYHLWWHPHNFSQKTEEAFEQLESLIEHFKILQKEYGFESLNMSEIEERSSK